MARDSGNTEPRSRRAILAGAIGGVAALVAGRFASPEKTSAAHLPGFGHANAAGGADTSLTATTAGTALLVTQSGTGTALRGSAVGPGSIAGFFTAGNGTGISGVTGTGTSYGVFASNNGPAGAAGALRANGGQNHGIVASTANNLRNAITASANVAGATAIVGTGQEVGVEGLGYRGVYGHTNDADSAIGVWGEGSTGSGNYGVLGTVNHPDGKGVYGLNYAFTGPAVGVYGQTAGSADGAAGVRGTDAGGIARTNGVWGSTSSSSGNGVWGQATTSSVNAFAVFGEAAGAGRGVVGSSVSGPGVLGISVSGNAVQATGNAAVSGNLAVTGTVSKGAGSFKIDHPLDPANKFLYHSFVESPDMLNVYSGVATLGENGAATVKLPAYFDALNADLRYQLTAIGRAAPDLHIRSKVKENAFSIAGGAAGQEVSWLVTGVRQDAYAKAHPIVAEVAKAGREKGRYLHPTENGVAESKAIDASPTAAPR